MSKFISVNKKKSFIKETLEKKKAQADLVKDGYFTVSFRHLDKKQGHNLYEWEQGSKLAHAMDVLAGYCCDTVEAQKKSKKFTVYGDFPPKEKTDYTFPNHVPEDAEWARIHVTGLQCIIGHIVGNVFYVVFLDGEHKFWKSELKNT